MWAVTMSLYKSVEIFTLKKCLLTWYPTRKAQKQAQAEGLPFLSLRLNSIKELCRVGMAACPIHSYKPCSLVRMEAYASRRRIKGLFWSFFMESFVKNHKFWHSVWAGSWFTIPGDLTNVK